MQAWVLGLSMGLAAGISPGPLLLLVVTTTLRSGWRAGLLVAAAPLATDVLVVATALLVLDRVPVTALNVLGVAGGLFVVFTGVTTVRQARGAGLATPATGPTPAEPAWVALRRAAIVNLLSPHPWIAWATALGPLVVATGRSRPVDAVVLVAGFYLMLVGAKAVVALLVAGGRRRLGDVGYRRSLLVAGALLVAAGLALLVQFTARLAG